MTNYALVGVVPWRHTVVGGCIMQNVEYKKILFNAQYLIIVTWTLNKVSVLVFNSLA